MSSLKLISLNIERSKHLDTVLPFLERERPDVLCLQELREKDIPMLEARYGADIFFAPNGTHPGSDDDEAALVGLGMASRLSHGDVRQQYYRGSEEAARNDPADRVITHVAIAILMTSFTIGETAFKIGTTHFTWTPNGKPDDVQRADMKAMLNILSETGEFVLCGDFNAPRGGEIWNMLASKYKDNIPPEYKTSIDVNLHRAGKEKAEELSDKMVDGLFTTPGYVARDVRLEFGVSDHAAVIATIARAS